MPLNKKTETFLTVKSIRNLQSFYVAQGLMNGVPNEI